MTLRSVVITYDGLPISSGGAHSLGKRPPGEVWPDLLTFLSTCSDFELPDQVNFLYYESRQSPRDYARRVRGALNPVYGRGARRVIGSDAGWKEWETCWLVPRSGMSQALESLQRLLPAPDVQVYSGRPLVLAMSASFRLRDPASGSVLPHQDPKQYGHHEGGWKLPLGRSHIYVRLSDRTTCSIFLSLPFEEVGPVVLDMISHLQARLPFKFSSKHWKLWRLNATKTAYYPRKLQVA